MEALAVRLGGLANEGNSAWVSRNSDSDVDLASPRPTPSPGICSKGRGCRSRPALEQHATETAGHCWEKVSAMPRVVALGCAHFRSTSGTMAGSQAASRLYLVAQTASSLALVRPEQHHGSTVGGMSERRRFAADTVTGTRYQNDLVL